MSNIPLINPEIIIQYLNSLLLLDSKAISKLIEFRVPVNDKIINHDTVQFLQTVTDENIVNSVGLLGILNGLCGVDEDGLGFIMAKQDVSISNEEIIKFIHKKDIDK